MGFFVLACVNTWLCNFWQKKERKSSIAFPVSFLKLKNRRGERRKRKT